MRIIALRPLREFCTAHADAEDALKAWYSDANRAVWKTPSDIKRNYANASFVGNNRVVFNVRGNIYRLVVAINYTSEIVYVRFVGTHSEYDRIDAATI